MSHENLTHNSLEILSMHLTRYVLIIAIVLGTIGTVMNIIIFMRRSFRSNPCSVYLTAASLDTLLIIYFALIVHLLDHGYGIKILPNSSMYCKIQKYMYYISTTVAPYCFVLASIDRYLVTSSNVKFRHMSRMSHALVITTITVFLLLGIYSQALVYFRTINSKCMAKEQYAVYFAMFSAMFCSICPPVLVTIFGALTVRNVRRIGRGSIPGTSSLSESTMQRKDHCLVSMVLIQVLATILLMYPFGISRLFAAINIGRPKSAEENFLLNCFRLLKYVYHMSSFYIFTLSTKGFRNEIVRMKYDLLLGWYKMVERVTHLKMVIKF